MFCLHLEILADAPDTEDFTTTILKMNNGEYSIMILERGNTDFNITADFLYSIIENIFSGAGFHALILLMFLPVRLNAYFLFFSNSI